ncbi:hypothetical protein [Roseomonas elaeocarpi]|uniref:Carboxypeptidase regulatory-like domain-containing protein n=1 Tax=Roseomonas elaeocarpi TaxID=907779 RepID=A0ABV6JQP4_9PROT
MPPSPTIDYIDQSYDQGGFGPTGKPQPTYVFIEGTAPVGHGIAITNATTGETSSNLNPTANDKGIYDFSFFTLGYGTYYATDLVTGETSGRVDLIAGTPGGDLDALGYPTDLYGPVIGSAAPNPTTISPPTRFNHATLMSEYYGTIHAYSVVPDDQGQHATGARIYVDNGHALALPISIAELRDHYNTATPRGGNGGISNPEPTLDSLVLVTDDATVQFSRVPTLVFNDITLTVQHDRFVDFLFYDSHYPDVAALDLNVREHYDTYGWHEGRDPNAFFDTDAYLAFNRDVAAAGVNPLDHYDASGWKEGRSPSAAFDTRLYLDFNPDVAASGLDPLAHYLQYGIAEGRKISPVVDAGVVRNGFDATYYGLANADVSSAGVDALNHFNDFGWREGRNPDAFFDTNWYLAQNPDVKAANVNPLAHYEVFGWREGRDPSTHFSTAAYLAAYHDVAAAGIDPLDHFLQFGAAEGRSGFGDLY